VRPPRHGDAARRDLGDELGEPLLSVLLAAADDAADLASLSCDRVATYEGPDLPGQSYMS
jgi:hypothetical protein